MRRRYESKTHLFENGFQITARKMGNWTEYGACQLNADGYVVSGRSFYSCYRREADAKLAEWRAQDQNQNVDATP